MIWWISFAVGWLFALIWLFGAIPTFRYLRGGHLADRARSIRDPAVWPTISLVVPARDEEGQIEQALRSLAALDYPSLEIIAVNDRSRDATGEIIDRVAAEEIRVRALHISTLPEGWLGKCHAMHRAVQQASGELLLFTDGDVVFAPDTLRLAVRYFADRQLDHLTLLPGITRGGYWEDAVKIYTALLIIFGTRAWAVNSASKNLYLGAGAFNLVRRTAYEATGGHATLRLEVIDDIMLGKLIKQAGYRQDALLATSHLQLAWYTGVSGFVRGLEKNGFASIGYSLPYLLFVTIVIALFYAVPYLGLLASPDARASGFAATVVIMHALYGCAASNIRSGWLLTPALPAAAAIYLWANWRSALITLRQGGIRWRETFYSLDVLKRRSNK